MSITASNYDRMRAAAEDPESDLDDDLRSELKSELSAYEQKRQTAGLPQYGMQTSAEAIEKTEKEFPRPKPAKPSAKPQAAAEEEDEDPEVAFQRSMNSEFEATRQDIASTETDDALPSASKRKSLYAPPEFMPANASFTDIMTAQPFLEPPIEMARAALKDDSLTEEDPRYKEFADSMWAEAYSKAESLGKPATRVAYMKTKSWGDILKMAEEHPENLLKNPANPFEPNALADAIANKGYSAIAKLGAKVGPVVTGADRSMLFGLGTKMASKIVGALPGAPKSEDIEKTMYQLEEASPGATMIGSTIGALNPRSAASRLFGGVSGKVAGPGAGLGRRLAGAAAGGAAAGAAESLGTELVRQDVQELKPGEMLIRALLGGGAGGLGGLAGEGIGSAAGALVKRNRVNPETGPLLAQAEAAGMTTGPLAKSREIVDIERANPGRHLEDVLSEPVARKVSQQRLAEQSGVIERQAAENVSMEGQLKRHRPEGLRFQVWKEYDRLLDNPHASEASKRELLNLLTNMTEGLNPGPRHPEKFAELFLDQNIAAPAKEMFADDYNRMLSSIAKTAERADISEPDAWKRILNAAMKERDAYPGYQKWTGSKMSREPALRHGNRILPEGSMSATKGRHDIELTAQRDLNEALGLPATLKPRTEPAEIAYRVTDEGLAPPVDTGATAAISPKAKASQAARGPRVTAETVGPATPDLDVATQENLNRIVQAYKRAPGQEAKTAALEHAARIGGFQDELDRIAGSSAYKKLRELGSFRAAGGTSGRLGFFTSKPAQAAALSLDPLARILSRQLPKAGETLPELSPMLRDFLSRITGKGRTLGPLNPLAEMAAGGRGSARRLGPGAAGLGRKRRELRPEEVAALVQLVEARKNRQEPAEED